MVMFVELVAALVLSGVLLEVYRVLRRREAFSPEAVAMDLFLGVGTVAAIALWFGVFSQAVMA